MNENKFFMHRIKCENDVYDKGIEVKDSYEDAKQSFHAYLGAYAYGQASKPNVTMVSCMITDMSGAKLLDETWRKPEPAPEPEPEE